ncbi:hypothetical protein PHMEG_00030371 [Phytophthora megakarya]|uniref:Uncharacterized protein n=1 Tax=Phytophthora megakarya TaxID=4795 RepID=A0A225V311_9STRA|nr:hypothetical protein PHMEG_00030371 [Phytophthora megakarya]
MRPEFRLRRGERYGWWHDHEQEESRKIALVHGAVNNHVVDVWVANIDGGLDVLLGVNFMFSAGVRLCVKEGLVQLPDEETVLLSGRGLSHAWLTEFDQSTLCICNLGNTGRFDCPRSES